MTLAMLTNQTSRASLQCRGVRRRSLTTQSGRIGSPAWGAATAKCARSSATRRNRAAGTVPFERRRVTIHHRLVLYHSSRGPRQLRLRSRPWAPPPSSRPLALALALLLPFALLVCSVWVLLLFLDRCLPSRGCQHGPLIHDVRRPQRSWVSSCRRLQHAAAPMMTFPLAAAAPASSS